MSRAWPSGRRARSPRDMAASARRRRGALRRPWRAAPTRAAGGQGGRCHERGLRAGGQDRRGIWRGDGGGVVLFDARGERLRPAPLEVKEGDVTSVAFGPEGQIAAGYGVAAAAAAWCSSTPGASGSDPRRWRSRRAMSRAWPSGRRARSPRDMASAAAAAAWCSSTPGASGSDPRRWRSRRAMSRAWPSGRRARSPRDMAAARRRRRGALRRPGRAAPTRAAGGQGGRCHERGLRAGGPDRRGIWRGDGGGVVLFDARGERLRPAPLEVKEGDVTSVAFGPEGQIAAGYGGGGGAAAWCSSTPGASGSDPRRWRSRRAMSRAWPSGRRARSPRDMAAAAAAAWCSSTPGASGSDPRRWRSRRAMSRAWPSGRRARSPRDMASASAAAWCSSTPGASGSDPRRWRSRRAMSRAWPSGRRARSPRDMAAAASAAWWSSTPGASGSDPRRWRSRRAMSERGLRAGGPDRRGIWRRGRGVGGVVLFDARGERLRPAPLEVKEGDVTSVAFGPEGQIAAGYGGGRRRRRGALRRPGRAAPTRAAGGQGGRCHERGLRAGGPDRRGIWRRRRRRRGALRRPGRAAPTRAAGGQGGRCQERGLRAGGPDRRGISRRRRGGVVLFDADPASWLRKAGQTANRNFTRLEWTRYFPETPYRRTIRSLPWPHDLPEAERKQAEAFEKEHPEGSDAS